MARRAPLWSTGGGGFLASALLVGALVGPVDLGVGGVVQGTFAHVLGLHNPLSPTDDAILWQVRLPRVVLGGIVGAKRALVGGA
jgi:iron complex transport system permease protein